MTGPTRWLRELRHSWPLLRGERRTEIATIPLGGRTTNSVRAGVDGNGTRHLLIPVGEEELRVDPADGALLVALRTYTFSRVPLRYLDISCSRPDLFDLFDEVLVDVLAAADGAPERPARVALVVVGRWRALLKTHRPRLLTLVGQMALFGELTVLDTVTRDGDLDISWWRGPRLEPHDIVLPECAIEVKAVGASSTSVEIHGVHQLEPPGVPLALVLATVVEDGAGTSLPELVERVLARVMDRGKAVRLLATAGYSQADADDYGERFAVVGIAHVEATDAVPRIVPTSFAGGALPAGVDGVTYRIDLDAIDHLVARGESALREWVGAHG